MSKSKQTLIDADIRHPLEPKSKILKSIYPYPYGSISSPNYPQNYSNNIVRKLFNKKFNFLIDLSLAFTSSKCIYSAKYRAISY